MPLIIPANSAVSGGFNVDNSARFNKASADNLIRTFGTATNRRKWTLSMWTKRSSTAQAMLYSTSSASSYYQYQSGGQLELNDVPGSTFNYRLVTNALYRDLSAWYHIVIAFDSTQGTDSNRIKLYVNGEQPSLATATYPSQNFEPRVNNAEAQKFGSYDGSTDYSYDGYFSELTFIDGQQLDPTSFGEFDEDSGIWKPIKISGLTFGNNGFHLDFKDSSALGNDAAGSNNFTVNNLTAIDQTTDTCTNNFATLNPLDNFYTPHSLSEGNLKQTTDSSSGYAPNLSTIALTQGKWYFEVKYVSRSSSDNYNLIGIKSTQITDTKFLGQNAHDYGYYSENGNYYTNNGATSYGASYDQGNIIGCYLDLDNNKLYFAKNGAIQNSGTGISITAPASTPLGHYFFAVGDYGGSLTIVNECNFGNPLYTGTDKSDANGYGSFEYDPSVGTFNGVSKDFYALNTKNLAEFG